MKLLATPDTIERQFLRLMRGYSSFSWATAWASASSKCFRELIKHKRKIGRIIVGTHFYQTHPDFIEEFLGSDVVKFIPRTDELFHPKLYLFENNNRDWELLIGSANFTHAAFSTNTEATVLLSSTDDATNGVYAEAKRLLGDSWRMAESFDTKKLAAYRLVWEGHQPKLGALGGKYGPRPGKPLHKSAVVTKTWDTFYQGVLQGKGSNVSRRLKVLELAASWFRQVEDHGKSFQNLGETERKAIAGTLSYERSIKLFGGVDVNAFGSMRGNGVFKNLVITNNPNLSRALDAIPLSGKVEEAHFLGFIEHFKKLRRCKLATATRLLAMKRPDYFVCLDNENRARLCEDFGITASSMTFDKYWTEIVGRIMESTWWNTPRPSDPQEAGVWNGRSAFLDALYYEG